MNQELQSTPQAMEAFNKRLQAKNQELVAHNSQLQARVQALQAVNSELDNLFNSVDVATLLLDSQLHIKRATAKLVTLFKLIPADMNQSVKALCATFLGQDLLSEAHTVLAQSQPIERELQAENGCWYVRRVLPYRTQTQAVEGVVISFTEVTEHRQAQEQIVLLNRSLKQRVDELQKILDMAPIGIAVARDSQCQVITTNIMGGKILGVRAGDNVSMSTQQRRLNYRFFLDGKELTADEMPMQYAVTHGVSLHDNEFDVVFNDGRSKNLLVSATPLYDEWNMVRGCVATYADITARKQVEQMLHASEAKLRDQTRRLEEADQRKNEFLAMLAHELRNPLASIRSVLELLKTAPEELPPVELRSIRDILDRQVSQLTRLVNDLLDTARITQGRIELHKMPVALADVIAQAIEASRPVIDMREHELTVSLPPKPLWLQADPARLVQVLTNLLNNAAQYMDTGGPIWLLAEPEGGTVIIKVIDRGIGIPADILPRVFELFTQANPPLHRPQGGLGLGLALVRKLVEMHGGSVQAFSEGPGRGSMFMVRLPILASDKAPKPAATPPRTPGSVASAQRILIVDDNKDLGDSLALLLRRHGHDVRVVGDGESALAAIPSYNPEVVFLDIGLPGIDGYEVARRLREDPHRAAMRLVALTGYGQEDDVQRITAAGFDLHMLKPVRLEDLQAALSA